MMCNIYELFVNPSVRVPKTASDVRYKHHKYYNVYDGKQRQRYHELCMESFMPDNEHRNEHRKRAAERSADQKSALSYPVRLFLGRCLILYGDDNGNE